MTGRTHDLAAFTTLTVAIALFPLPHMSVATAVTAFGANMMGGLMPDLDDATSGFWQHIRAGTFIGKIIHPLIGHHRMISHSILGMAVAGYLLRLLLGMASRTFLVDMQVIWWATMAGYASHLVMDLITKEGIPLLFPVPVRVGFPPLRFMRIRTGSLVESLIVFPGLLAINAFVVYAYYPTFLTLFRSIGI